MQPDKVTVTLAVGTAPYQKTLAASLLAAGMLRRLLTSGPYLEIQDPNGSGSLREIKRFPLNRIVNGVLWGAWRRLPKGLRPRSPVMVTVVMKDELWSRWIPPCSIFHGWMGQSLGCLPAAKRQGARTLVEHAGRHAGDFHKAPWEECQRFNIKPSQYSPLLPTALIRRMEREYEICDRIVVPSNLARRSFAEFGLANKTIVVFPGVDEQFFSATPQQRDPQARRLHPRA